MSIALSGNTLVKKPSSFFRRRKKSTAEPMPLPVLHKEAEEFDDFVFEAVCTSAQNDIYEMYKAKPPAENTLKHDVPLPRQRCRPSSKLLLGAGARTPPNPASQPIYNAASSLTYPHACEQCIGTHSEEREAEIVARYAPEKEAQENRIEELQRMGPLPLLSELDVQLVLAEYELSVLEFWEEQEIQRAWQVYNELW